MPTTFAYIRVSTDKLQTTDNQRKLIQDAGFNVDEWYSEDGVSGKIKALDRPQFKELMSRAVEGDTVIAVALDRLGRNTIDVLNTVQTFQTKNIKLRCMALDGIDLTSTSGKILVHMLALMAELEVAHLSARTKAGLARTKAEGTNLGRYMKVTPEVLEAAIKGRDEGVTWTKLSAEHSVDKNTLLQACKKWGSSLAGYKARWEQQLLQAERKASESLAA